MASSAQFLCLLLLLCLHAFSLPIHAREYQFFNKLTPTTAAPATNTKAKECEEHESPTITMTPDVHNGHGLYGHDIDQEGAEFTSSITPENTLPQERKGGENSEYSFNNGIPYNNNHGYEAKQNSPSGDSYNSFRYPVQQQGMSDTRFLENGKYFYDVNNEELYKNRYHNIGVNSGSHYNTQGVDDNLYKFNNFMEDNQESQGVEDNFGVNSRNQHSNIGGDGNLYKSNNFMEDNQERQGEYVP